MGAIIQNDLLRFPISTDDVILYELSHVLGFRHRVGGHFHPLGEVVDYHWDVLVSILGFRRYSSDHIYALY